LPNGDWVPFTSWWIVEKSFPKMGAWHHLGVTENIAISMLNVTCSGKRRRKSQIEKGRKRGKVKKINFL
jgi:hypothetical protein